MSPVVRGNRAVLPATGAAVGLTGALSTGSLVLGLATMVLVAVSIFQVLRPAPDPRS